MDGGTPEVERNLEGAFQGLTLAIKCEEVTIAAIGERFARMSLLTLAALSLVLAGGNCPHLPQRHQGNGFGAAEV